MTFFDNFAKFLICRRLTPGECWYNTLPWTWRGGTLVGKFKSHSERPSYNEMLKWWRPDLIVIVLMWGSRKVGISDELMTEKLGIDWHHYNYIWEFLQVLAPRLLFPYPTKDLLDPTKDMWGDQEKWFGCRIYCFWDIDKNSIQIIFCLVSSCDCICRLNL